MPRKSLQPTDGLAQLAMAEKGAAAATVYDQVAGQVGGIVQSVITRAVSDYLNGTLDPNKALLAWADVAAAQRLLRRFETAIKMGASAGAAGPAAQE